MAASHDTTTGAGGTPIHDQRVKPAGDQSKDTNQPVVKPDAKKAAKAPSPAKTGGSK